jgi:two-component system sensor histidine kinase VicK
VAGSYPDVDRQALGIQATYMGEQQNARIVVIDAATNQKVADSRPNAPLDVTNYRVLPTAMEARGVKVGTQTIGGVDYATAAVPVTLRYPFSDQVVLVVLITSSLSDVQKAVQDVQRQMLYAAGIAIAITLATGYLASFFIARRLKRVERGALAIAHGDFSVPVATGMHDEIGQLATTFNTMGQSLREAFGQIAREKQSVEVLLNDLAEGVIGVSEQGALAVANPAAASLLGRALPHGIDLAEVLPNDVVQALDDTRDDGDDRTLVVPVGARTVEWSVYGVGRQTEVHYIVVLRDVTEQARLEQARRDFIATASHELKTPLFSLSGFMELLDEGELSPEEEREFMSLMRQQVDRLTDLSLSLLDLSQVDAGAVRLEPDETDVTTLTAAVASEFQASAATRHIDLEVAGAAGETALCDERRLTQVLRALLDNAIKFSPDGGRVTIEVKGRRKSVSISVKDAGPGIPAAELPRIFQRFYRGTGGRGAKAGTGLGLSIAREMAELMGGGLTVRSRPGEGSAFTVQVPRPEVKKP